MWLAVWDKKILPVGQPVLVDARPDAAAEPGDAGPLDLVHPGAEPLGDPPQLDVGLGPSRSAARIAWCWADSLGASRSSTVGFSGMAGPSVGRSNSGMDVL